MLHSLPLFHRINGQPVIVAGEGDSAAAKRRLVERAGGEVVSAMHGTARLAFVATEEPEALAAMLKARGVLVNVPDRPDLCDFILPSLLERGPVLVAVSTSGLSAGLAKALRLRLEGFVPQALGSLALALGAAREAIRGRWPDTAERRRALDAALAEGGPLDPFSGVDGKALQAWIGTGESGQDGTFEFRLTSDDPDDLTLRQARLLGSADRVLHEAGVPEAILIRARADAVRVQLADADSSGDKAGLTVIIRRD